MSSSSQKPTENRDDKKNSAKDVPSQASADDGSQTPSEPRPPETEPPQIPATPMPDVPMPDVPTPHGPPAEPPEPLSEREKYLVSVVTQQVLNRIDPLLIKLQQISNEAVSMGAQQKLQELERGINERIEHRINKINAIIGRRGR